MINTRQSESGIHTRIGDFGDLAHEEQESKEQDKDGNGSVDPLHVGERLLITKVEEDVGAENRGDDGSNAVEGLRQVDSDLGIFRRTADWGKMSATCTRIFDW